MPRASLIRAEAAEAAGHPPDLDCGRSPKRAGLLRASAPWIHWLLATAVGAQPYFTDVSDQAGLPLWPSRSVAFGDYDNDGWPDVFTAAMTLTRLPFVALLHNEGGGRFADHTHDIRSPVPPGPKGGGSVFGDYDNDGDLDLYVTVGGWIGRAPDLLLRNDRGRFVDVASQAGLTTRAGSDNAIWLDYDRDGHLDLYVGVLVGADRNALYRNRGDGTFTDVTSVVGLDHDFSPADVIAGSNGGLVATDFDGDGWPDLYVGVFAARNRLFLSTGDGRFEDATTTEAGHEGLAHGVAAGDADGDGLTDIFQAAGGSAGQEQSPLLLNLGAGQFLDVGDGAGLAGLNGLDVSGPGMVDIDNDGDLDLVISDPTSLFVNPGRLPLIDETSVSGLAQTGTIVAAGDFDGDGFPDLWFGSGPNFQARGRAYRNNGNGHHWLRVVVTGVQSNRDGIGARLTATVGERRLVREVFGGLGYQQDEMVAHFGLGNHTQVDSLAIRWPSGHEDVLHDLPGDQTIRVVEGRQGSHAVRPVSWNLGFPDTVWVGQTVTLSATVRPSPFVQDARITSVAADLSRLGGEPVVALTDLGDGTYELSESIVVSADHGIAAIPILIDQETAVGPRWSRVSSRVFVLRGEDLPILADGSGAGWRFETEGVTSVDHSDMTTVFAGGFATSLTVDALRQWRVNLLPSAPVSAVGFVALHLAFHPGDAQARVPNLILVANGRLVDLIGRQMVDPDASKWQQVELPLHVLNIPSTGTIASISLAGRSSGTFYLDDVRLVAEGQRPSTAVTDILTDALAESFALSQNYPNPFNSETSIGFEVPASQDVELAVYNLAGQRLATLVRGYREAGSYLRRWNGRDDAGREVASGVYVYRLTGGNRVETRKLLLLR